MIARVRRGAGDDELRTMLLGEALHRVVVDRLGFRMNSVRHDIEVTPAVRERVTVREVSTVRQVHSHDRVARLQHGEINGHIRLRARVRLNVHVLGAEELLRAIDRQTLDDVGRSTTAVVSPSRVSFCVLVREHRAGRGEHGLGDVVLRRDQLQRVILSRRLRSNGLEDLGVDLVEPAGNAVALRCNGCHCRSLPVPSILFRIAHGVTPSATAPLRFRLHPCRLPSSGEGRPRPSSLRNREALPPRSRSGSASRSRPNR